MRISDWSSDVCSSDLLSRVDRHAIFDLDGRSDHFAPFLMRNSDDHTIKHRRMTEHNLLDLPGKHVEAARDDHVPLAVDDIDVTVCVTQIGSAHVCTPVTNAHLVCRLLLEKTNTPPSQQ